MYSKTKSSFIEISESLNKIYKNIENQKTEEHGIELFKKLIIKNLSKKTLIFSIINNLEEKIMEMPLSDISKYLNLLSVFFEHNLYNISIGIYSYYLNPILSIIQSLIIDKNIEFLPNIPEIFVKIIQNLIPDDINAKNKRLNNDEKKIYEILQNFCFFNIKIDKELNQVIGGQCLTKLIENCSFLLKDEYIKIITENIITELSNENFNAKYELLNCLISLILGVEKLFNPYATIVFNNILDFLANEDWKQRKLALNIIYTLSLYCKDEIMPLKEHLLIILDVLKRDKIKEIRDISFLILKIYENEKKPKKNLMTINKKKKRNLSSSNIINKVGKINYIKYNIISSISPVRSINNIKNKIQKLKPKNLIKEINKTPKKRKSKEKRKKSFFSASESSINNRKFINRTKNFSFVNERMKIKPDPKKSIFNSNKNMAFFNQNNNSDSKNKNLIIISNKEENNLKKNYNTIEGFYKNENKDKDVNFDEKNNTYIDNGNIEENIKKINNDYDKSKESINRLISLDALIKTENIKKFENNLIYSINNKETLNHSQNNKDIKNKSLMKALLSQVRELSNKQISFLDLMEELQTNTQNQIEDMNMKIINLDNVIKELDEKLYILENDK